MRQVVGPIYSGSWMKLRNLGRVSTLSGCAPRLSCVAPRCTAAGNREPHFPLEFCHPTKLLYTARQSFVYSPFPPVSHKKLHSTSHPQYHSHRSHVFIPRRQHGENYNPQGIRIRLPQAGRGSSRTCKEVQPPRSICRLVQRSKLSSTCRWSISCPR